MPGEKSDATGKARIGVVLSSGGVRGVFAHTGFMQAIQGLGILITARFRASEQAEVQLAPHLGALIRNPHKQLQKSGITAIRSASGCVINDNH